MQIDFQYLKSELHALYFFQNKNMEVQLCTFREGPEFVQSNIIAKRQLSRSLIIIIKQTGISIFGNEKVFFCNN